MGDEEKEAQEMKHGIEVTETEDPRVAPLMKVIEESDLLGCGCCARSTGYLHVDGSPCHIEEAEPGEPCGIGSGCGGKYATRKKALAFLILRHLDQGGQG